MAVGSNSVPVSRDHRVHFCELSDISQKVQQRNTLSPVVIVEHLDTSSFCNITPCSFLTLKVRFSIRKELVYLSGDSVDVSG